MIQARVKKQNFSALTIEQAMKLTGKDRVTPWPLLTDPREPSVTLLDVLKKLASFDQISSEQAKMMIVDAMLIEVVTNHPKLKVWKGAPLTTDTLTGIADYLITPNLEWISSPLVCIVEAKRDDFEKGRVQCIAEMIACRWNTEQMGFSPDVHGIVSNGQGWIFYKLSQGGDVLETETYTTRSIGELLGTLNFVLGECAKNVH